MTDYETARAAEIQEAIRSVLLHDWDPIGVADVAEAQDEYDSYVGPVYRLLVSDPSDEALIDYLYKTETKTMGLTNFGMGAHLRPVVAKLRQIDVQL
jgi:hypothetical protein